MPDVSQSAEPWGQPVDAAALPPPRIEAASLAKELAQSSVRTSTSDQDRLSYSRDMWPRALIWIRQGRIPPPPDAVAWPANEEEVLEIVSRARERKVALIPFGAGSGVCGGTWATRGGIAIDLKRLDEIGPLDAERRCVDAGAGTMGEVLERKLATKGYTLGHFPSSMYMSTVGGWLAARGAGQMSNKYGKIEDMVLSLRAVTGRAEIVETPERPFVGPDLSQLLIGSEGTLGVITRARLRVHPAPEGRTFRGIKFRSVADGVEAIRQVYRGGLRPAVVRLYDPFDTALVGREKPSHRRTPPSLKAGIGAELYPAVARQVAPLALGHPWALNRAADLMRNCLLVLLFEGEARRAAREDAQALAICRKLQGEDLGEEPGRHWYEKRYDVSYKMSKVIDSGAFADTMEVAATWDKVLDVYERVRAAVARLAFVMCHFSHAYLEGCSLYFSFAASAPDADGLERRYRELWRAAQTAAASAGATVSHHHGVGLLKTEGLLAELNDGRRLLSALKRVLDPDGVMNPGKLGL
ncbi:MAG: FAD-binding oxidoreductase [Myxococcales bacterium]|nr:FAD-binding oxidoreductase [Myxococcales bacterium]